MTTLTCEECGNAWPVEDFPNIGSVTVCQHCILGHDIDAVRSKLLAQTQMVAKHMDEFAEPGKGLGKVKDVLELIYQEFGGPAAFARKFVGVIDDLQRRKQVPASAASLMLSVMKLHEGVEAREEDTDIRKMTDDQIRRAQELELAKLMMDAVDDPGKRALVERMLGKTGYKLEKVDPREEINRIADKLGVEVEGGIHKAT